MEKLLKTLDKTLPSWVDDLFPENTIEKVNDDKHLMSHFIKPAEDKLGLNRLMLHHFEEPASTTSASSSQHSSSSAAVIGKRKRGNNSSAPATRKSSRKTVNSTATASALEEGTAEEDSSSSSDDFPTAYHHYAVLNELLGGNRLTPYDFVEKVPKGTDILLLLPGGAGASAGKEDDDKKKSSSGGGGGGHHYYDAKLQSLLQASQHKVPVVTRVGDVDAEHPWYVFKGTFVKVERMNGIFHGVALARNPPTIVVEIHVGDSSSGSNRPCLLTLNMLNGVNDFLLWSPSLHADFESTFSSGSSSIWKKIVAPHGHGQNNADRNRLLASLLQLVQHDPIRTAQVCQVARQVYEKIASKKLSNAMRSLGTKAAAKLRQVEQEQTKAEAAAAATATASSESKKEQPRKRGARNTSNKSQAKPKSSKKKAPTTKKKVAPSKAAAAKTKKPTKKKSSTTTKGKKAAPKAGASSEATDDHMEDTTTTATTSTSPARMSSPAEVSLLASSGMQFLLDAADMADSLEDEEQEHSSFESQTTMPEECASSSFGAQAGWYSRPNEVQGPAQASQQHVGQEQSMSQGEKMQDPLGFLCSVVAAKPSGAAADAHVVATDQSST